MRSVIRLSLFLLCLVILPSAILADNDSSQKKKKTSDAKILLQEGLRFSYNNDFEKAEEKFNAYIAQNPKDPVGYWRKLCNRYLKARIEKNDDTPWLDDKPYEEFVSTSDVAIRYAEEKIAASATDDKDFYIYVKESLQLYRGVIQYARTRSVGDMIDNAKEAINIVKSLKNKDAQALAGFASYKIGSMPWYAKPLAAYYHLSGNHDKGLDTMFSAVKENDGIFSDDVRLLIVVAYTPHGKKNKTEHYREAEVIEIYKDFVARYPQNKDILKFKAARGL